MERVTYSVISAPGGWTVDPGSMGEPLMFLSGGRAEAAARALGKATWAAGRPAEVLIHDRDGRLVGGWMYGSP